MHCVSPEKKVNHFSFFFFFLTMAPSQEPSFQVAQKTINGKVQSFVWVYVVLG
jgi:hypothetical protein